MEQENIFFFFSHIEISNKYFRRKPAMCFFFSQADFRTMKILAENT